MPHSRDKAPAPPPSHAPRWTRWLLRGLAWIVGLGVAGALAGVLVVGVGLAMAYPNLPDVSDLADYRPKLPLRVYSSEGALLGEFGEERRNLTPIEDIPAVMTNASTKLTWLQTSTAGPASVSSAELI